MNGQVEAELDCYIPTIYSYAKTTGYGGPSTCLVCIYENL